ncbi:serine hydrolase [Microbacterium sp. STN6]|uniref:serine hydrolase domain-containing protein n=1 Tax=Microbacterium sp. STN6 TaxID=2995588 RepID=UPI00226082D4|nr:serine hydrolase domain-containing protein [Microbacterium sp. STN6]MCX7521408.1 serine hydrolase [Microbacterium sp. STN6]
MQTSSPSQQGVDADGILRLIDALDADPGQNPHSLMIVRHGRIVASGWWAPYARDRPHLLYSLSKSFTSTAAAFAVAEGLIDLDTPVIDYFPEFADDIVDPRSRSMLVRHVASMSSGHTSDTLDAAMANDPTNLVRGFLLVPPDRDPGTIFAYNQPATYTLAAIIQKRAGQTLVEYLRPRLFDPLDLPPLGWQEVPAGRNLGFTGLHAPTDAIARLGQLYLSRGRWGETQLIPAEWVDDATHAHIPTAAEPGITPTTPPLPDWSLGYGFQFWISQHGYRGDGAFGQFCVVLPEHDAVIAFTGATVEMQRTLELFWQHLVPAFGSEPRERTGADQRLLDRLADLRVAPVSTPKRMLQPHPARSADWEHAHLQPLPSAPRNAPTPEAVEVLRVGDEWRIALVDASGRIEARLGNGDWAVTHEAPAPPVAVEGGWSSGNGNGRNDSDSHDGDGDTLRFDVIFLETPHRLRLTCSARKGTFAASWSTVPLADASARLHDLQSPSPRG